MSAFGYLVARLTHLHVSAELRLATTSMDSSGHCPQTDPAVQGDPDAETEGNGRKGDGDHGGTGGGVEKGDGARDKGDGGKKLGVLPVGS